jgi:protein gp37
MARDSKIEWTHHTFNPWWGCTKVSPGCKHCYAETWARRIGQDVWGPKATRRELTPAYWKQPYEWNEDAEKSRLRARVFCASMADVFEDRRELDEKRERLWKIIFETPALDWLLLTKRPQNVAKLAPWGAAWPENVWLGATAENQKWLDKRMEVLTGIPARVLFLSCEPLLGPLDLSRWIDGAKRGMCRGINWVIGGGESGHHARPMHPGWIASLRDQCQVAGIKFLFKQWGNWRPATPRQVNGYKSRTVFLSNGSQIILANMGKKDAGRRLDGRTWDEFPQVIASAKA